jgi:hypothetical protein
MSAVVKSVEPSGCVVYGVGLRPLTTETAGSNPAFGMDVFSLRVLCVLDRGPCDKLITLPENSYRLW